MATNEKAVVIKEEKISSKLIIKKEPDQLESKTRNRTRVKTGRNDKTEMKPITQYFPLRRSTRRVKSLMEEEKTSEIIRKLEHKIEDGLKVIDTEGKGRGVIATRTFHKDELICEYSGELISYCEAVKREQDYSKDSSIGCYMYYFEFKSKKLCVDATKDNKRMGRLVNHSKTRPNVVTKLIPVEDHPYLCLMAARTVTPGEELVYDYGERKKDVIKHHQWLTS